MNDRASPNASHILDRVLVMEMVRVTEAAVRKAVEGITKDGHLTDKPQVIRIERAG